MATPLLFLGLVLLPAGGPSYKGTVRPPHPFAPSLPLLTTREYKEIEDLIDRFIQFDTGKLPGPEGKKALTDLMRLGPEAFPALLEGFNKAAALEDSCPAVIIGKKLRTILIGTQDMDLLDWARETIGTGIKARRHRATIEDLRVGCIVRKGALQRQILAAANAFPGKPPRSMSVAELADAAHQSAGPPLRALLWEIEKRQGPRVIDTLATAAAHKDKYVKSLARQLLMRHLLRLKRETLKSRLTDPKPDIRAAAALAIGTRNLPFGSELIELINDEDARVNQAARQALIQLAKGMDYGPQATASPSDRAAAAASWRKWWTSQP